MIGFIVLFVFGAEAEIGDLDGGQVIGVRDQDIIWLKVAMHDLIRVQVVDSLKDGLDYLGGFLVGKVDPLALLRHDEL